MTGIPRLSAISRVLAWIRSVLRGPGRRAAVEAEMCDEFRHHLALRTEDLIRQGLSGEEAARRARIEFGHFETHKQAARAAYGLRFRDRIGFSWLDVKLGFRMLIRYPGLTVIGGLAMAFAVWAGAGTFELVKQLVVPTLPLPAGDRVVGLWNWDAATAEHEEPTLHDFVLWRSELEGVDDLGAFRTVAYNLIGGEGRNEPVEVAEISASAFDVAGVPPWLGRTLIESDEQAGAPAVVVIGYDLWQRRFESDPDIAGRTVRLSGAPTTVVGVMPEGFAFPVKHHLWVPLRLNVLDYERGDGPELQLFGRLAPGIDLEGAQAELAALGQRAAAEFPETHEHLRPEVMPYAEALFPIGDLTASAGMYWFNLLGVMLMALMGGNVALLLFARAAARESELVVRNALGASRGRIIIQLFTEALVLGGVAAVAGLAAAGVGLRWAYRLLELNLIELPFWFDARLSPPTVIYAVALTVLGAVVAGVVPALKVTGKGMDARLRQASAGGGGFRFGGVWTAVIVGQVAVTLVFPVPAFFLFRIAAQIQTADVGFAEEEYLSARLEMDRSLMDCGGMFCAPVTPGPEDPERANFIARLWATRLELERRLLAEPGVLGVTFAQHLPRMNHLGRIVELDEGGAAPRDPRWSGYPVRSTSVAPDFFQVLTTEILAGRGFQPADVESGQRVVIVNESFVRQVLGGRNPIGRRLRDASVDGADETQPEPWHEIIGVVPDLAMGNLIDAPGGGNPNSIAGFYQPLPASAANMHIAAHVRGDPALFTPGLRRLATTVDPSLRLYEVLPLANASESMIEFLGIFLRVILMVSAIALLLSLAGIYAVMAFTVSRRTREIGIRIALGANRKRLALAVFR
ncbi:MAG: ABC transporter permease, partial [Longimicrobiales bacterium]